MYFGVDYYPEHWPKELWKNHARLMREANFNTVRIAEFAWAVMEPRKGEYDFKWLNEAIEILADEGLNIVIGTPTAAPPKWLVDEYSDIYAKDPYGRIRGFGSRRHYCYNSLSYREESKRIVSILAENYKDNPNVIAWQIDNEFGCHGTDLCFCDNCLSAFQLWLKNKYKSLEKLNNEWGTVFWSQNYNTWDEVILPAYTVGEEIHRRNFTHNPGLLLDFQRFSSDSVFEYMKIQTDEIRKRAKQPITHNFMGNYTDIDYYRLGEELDFVSWDNYPLNTWSIPSYQSVSFNHDFMRGVKRKNFWVMEQQSGPCGLDVIGETPKPGQLRLWTYQAAAHGAEAVIYFRFRACPFGTEEYWYGILDHDGIPRRRYKEIAVTGAELLKLSDLFADSKVAAETAIIKSHDNCWSHKFQPHNKAFDYQSMLLSYYEALNKNGINTDIISEEDDFSSYKLIVLPAFNLMREDLKKKLEKYTALGGRVVITFRSGSRNWNNSISLETLPGYFKDLAGIEVEEFDSLSIGKTVPVKGKLGAGSASIWCDIIKKNNTEVLLSYAGDYYSGRPAVTVNRFGKGIVYYVGCGIDSKLLTELMKQVSIDAEVKSVLKDQVEGVEAVLKEKNGRKFLVVMNHNAAETMVNVAGEFTDVISGKVINGFLRLTGYDVSCLVAYSELAHFKSK